MPAEIQVASGACARTTEASLGQPREGLAGVAAERCDPHHAAQPQPLGVAGSARRGRARRSGRQPGPAGRLRRVEAHLHQAVEVASPLLGSTAQPAHQLGAVDGVHHVGVGRDGRRLVALQAADEVPPHVEVGALGGLLDRLLVAVLPDVADAEVGEQPHVGGGEELGDHDQGDLVAAAPGVGAGRLDAVADGGQPLLDLVAPVSWLHPDHPGEATGSRPVATVGVEVRGLPGAAAPRRAPRRRPARAGRAPRRRCRAPGVPHDVVEREAGSRAATSCCSASGTS